MHRYCNLVHIYMVREVGIHKDDEVSSCMFHSMNISRAYKNKTGMFLYAAVSSSFGLLKTLYTLPPDQICPRQTCSFQLDFSGKHSSHVSTLAVFRYPEHSRFPDGIPDSPEQ